MRRMTLLLSAAALAVSARGATAQSCVGRTVDEIIASCDAAFTGSGPLSMSARGWCYLYNLAGCPL
jgi:hypothetical protein